MAALEIQPETALVLIDMQKAIDQPVWAKDGPRNHRNAELAALRVLEAWRVAGRPIYHVRHDSVEPESPYRPGQPFNEFKPGFEPRAGEELIVKHTCSAFVGTDFDARLIARRQKSLVIGGVITNNSVEATVRHAGTLGFDVILAEDACFTFARRDWNGVLRSADDVHAMSLANLDGEYCRVATSAEILAAAGSTQPILPCFRRPAFCEDPDDRAPAAAAYVGGLIEAACAGSRVDHVGSTSVPGCAGKGVLDLLVTYPEGTLEDVKKGLAAIGFQPQSGREPFPEDRPMRCGVVSHGGRLWRIHAHVIAESSPEAAELRWFRDRLRSDASLRQAYVEEKRSILARGVHDTLDYCYAKGRFIQEALDRRQA